MDDLDKGADRLVFRADAIRRGATDASLSRDVKNGVTERVWYGVYLPTEGTRDDSPAAELERYRMTVVAASLSGGPKRTASHGSAAAMHRIPMLDPDLSTVHFTSSTTGKSLARGIIHQAALPESDIMVVDDISVTSPARSVCDVARTGTLEQAVCVLDSGLLLGVTMDEIDEQMSLLRRHHGIAMLRAAAALANGLSESVGESVSRLGMEENPLIPTPELQVPISVEIAGRRKTVRADFGWRDVRGVLRVVGEFDGRLKYHRSNPFGDRLPEEVLYDEKLREDAIRATGPIVARWTWAEARQSKVMQAKVIAALRTAGLLQ